MNKMLQTNDTPRPCLLVAMEMSLKTWRLAMAVAGQPRKRVKTVEAEDQRWLPQEASRITMLTG